MQAQIYKITPFDASNGTTIKFAWYGNQAFKNRCIIKTNDTNQTTVYDKTIETFKLEHTIDLESATLENGKTYLAYITVFDNEDNESDIQAIGEKFMCLKTPVFVFTNIIEDQVVSSSNYEFLLSYSQENGELLDSWSISVYTREHTLLSSSGTKYDTSSLNYIFQGFSNKSEYCVRAVGQTINGISLDTGYIGFSVTYNQYSVFNLLELTNLPDVGAIQIISNIVSAEGKLKKEPPIFLDGEYIDLRDNELTFDEGFLFDGDFSYVMLFYGMDVNDEILNMYADDKDQLTATVTYRVGRFGSAEMQRVFELKIVSNGITSVYYSNKLEFGYANDLIGICIVRKDGYYSIQATIYRTGSGNMWGDVSNLKWGDVSDKTWYQLANDTFV